MADIPFHLVWREGGGSPQVQQETAEKARSEAVRLARANPGARFFVLAPVESYVSVDMLHERYDIDERIPF